MKLKGGYSWAETASHLCKKMKKTPHLLIEDMAEISSRLCGTGQALRTTWTKGDTRAETDSKGQLTHCGKSRTITTAW